MRHPPPQVLERAVELGVRHVDTAAFYGNANATIRGALHPYAGLTIATKVGPIFGGARTVHAMRDEGLIRDLGVSNVTSRQLAEARSVTAVAAVQNQFGVLDQSDGPLVDECAAAGIVFTPFAALGGGLTMLSGESLAKVADKHRATVFQVALAWGLARSPAVIQIPGTSSVAHLEENMAAGEIVLDESDMAFLSR